jgi:hypothetical protein
MQYYDCESEDFKRMNGYGRFQSKSEAAVGPVWETDVPEAEQDRKGNA